MARGTDAGLLEDRRAQSAHKHALLKQYIPRFIAMTAHGWGRVVLVDGFAGTGNAGGAPGSAALLAEAAQALGKSAKVRLELFEKRPANHQALQEAMDVYRRAGVEVRATKGEIQGGLDGVLDGAKNAALFWFLDPCGALLPFNEVVRLVNDSRRRSSSGGRVPTELLLNFSASLVRRVGGAWARLPHDADGVATLNAVCGGDWWQAIVRSKGPTGGADNYLGVVEAVAREYARRVAEATNGQSVVVPVRERAKNQPLYHLVFVTQSEHGVEAFLDATGRARIRWAEATGSDQTQPELNLWSDSGEQSISSPEARRHEAEAERKRTVETIRDNIRGILATVGDRFTPLEHISDVYGPAAGIATDTEVNRVLRELERTGTLAAITSESKPIRKTYSVDFN